MGMRHGMKALAYIYQAASYPPHFYLKMIGCQYYCENKLMSIALQTLMLILIWIHTKSDPVT